MNLTNDKAQQLLKLSKSPEELHKFVDDLDIKTLCTIVSSSLETRHICSVLKCVFGGLDPSSSSCQMKRYRVVERTLLEIKKKKSPKEMDIISLISNEIDKMEAKHVAHLADLCVDWAQNGTTELVGWKTVLPIVLTHLSDQQFVDAGDKEMKGPEFVSQKIHSLCAVYWKSESVIHLASMFVDMSLTPEEHKEVVMTLCKCMHRLDPQEVPPLVYLLLNMCKVNHCVTLYMNLDLYFTIKLYKGSLKDTNTVYEALNEVEMDETNVKDSRESEDTVLLHIYDAAMAYPKSIRDLVSFLRNLVCAPELVTRPFIFAVLLAISTIHFHEDMVCDFLKHTILKCFLEEEKRKASQWLRDNITKTTSLELVVNILIQNRVQDNVQVLYGMLNLGFILLDITSVSANISDLGKLWSLGSHIVLSLVRQESSVISKALEKLSFHISTRGAMKQHFDCLYELSMRVPMAMYECRSEITKMLQNLLYRPSSESECVMKALIPLTKTFPTLKDMLIINLRKGLYSRDPVLKKMSVCGFLIILKQQGLRGMSVLTQSSSVHENLSLHSQNHSNSSFTVDDESTFIEVLAILKICFTKYEEVKVCLYEGLCDSSIYKDPKLFTSIRVMLWSQMLEYYQENELILPPLNFKEAVVVKGIRAVVKEPLAQLVFVNQRIVTNKLIPGQSESLESVTVILESLCDRMTRCTLDDLDMRNNEFLLDNLPECLQKQEVFKMMLGTYEALMSYLVNSWTVETTDQGRKVALLFSSYLQLFELTKASSSGSKKLKEEGRGKRKRDFNTTEGKVRPTVFKPPPTLLDFETTLRVLQLLLNDSVSWSTTEAAKQLKGKRDFRRYIMRVVLSLIQKHSSLKQTDSRSSSNFVEFLQCGRILYEQCVSKIQQIADYDLISTAIALECFYELLKILLSRYQTNVTKYLADIGVNALGGVNGQLKRLIEDYKKLLEYSVESEEDHMDGEFEPTIRKITQIVVSTLALLPLHLSDGHLEPVYVWCKTYAEKKHMLNEVAAKSFVSLLLQLNRRCKARGQLIESMAKLLCRDIGQLDPDVSLTKVVEYKIVSQKLRMPLFSLLCSAINTNLNEIFWMVNWLRSEHTSQVKSGVTIIDNTDHWEELRSKEQELCLYLSHTIRELAMVSGVSVPVGPAVDTVLNTVAHLYNLLSSVVKYFIMRSSKDNPVFKLVKLESVFFVTSTIMAPRLNDLISLVTENKITDDEENPTKKKKVDNPQSVQNKILRESKLIPKVTLARDLYEKSVIKLSTKTKTKLKVLLECTKNRDFKITADQVKNKTFQPDTSISEGE